MTVKDQPSVPQSRAQVDPSWLTAVLSPAYPGIRVTEAEVGPFMGYKPNKVRVQVSYDAAGRAAGLPSTFIVKGGFRGGDAGAVDQSSATGLDIGTELEVLAYRDVVPRIDVNTPKAFYVGFDEVTYDGVVVLEDLAPRGVIFVNTQTALTYAQAAAFVSAMARFQARFWDSPALYEGGDLGPQTSFGQRRQRLHTGYLDMLIKPQYWDTYIQMPRGAALPEALRNAGRVERAFEKMHELHQSCPKCIVHGDEHLGNLYTEADGTAGFIDWCARTEAWPIGFTYFMMSTLDAFDRRNWERPLLSLYLRGLAEHGAKPPSFDEAWFGYRCTTIFPMLTWLNNSGKWQPEAVNTRHANRAGIAAMDHNVLDLLGV